jgi:hypothetical protein
LLKAATRNAGLTMSDVSIIRHRYFRKILKLRSTYLVNSRQDYPKLFQVILPFFYSTISECFPYTKCHATSPTDLIINMLYPRSTPVTKYRSPPAPRPGASWEPLHFFFRTPIQGGMLSLFKESSLKIVWPRPVAEILQDTGLPGWQYHVGAKAGYMGYPGTVMQTDWVIPACHGSFTKPWIGRHICPSEPVSVWIWGVLLK